VVGGCGVVTERTPAARPLDGVRGLPNLSRSRSASGHWPGQGCTAGLPGLPRGPDRRALWFPLPLWKATGMDPGHLSRILAGRSKVSLQTLQRILEPLNAALVIEPEKALTERLSQERAVQGLAAVAR